MPKEWPAAGIDSGDLVQVLVDAGLDDPRMRDAPLWIKYETKPLWSRVHQSMGLGSTGAAIALALYEATQAGRPSVSYSRHKGFYSRARRHPLLSYRKVIQAVEELEAGGWIQHVKRNPGDRGWQSTMAATPEMMAEMQLIIAEAPPLKLAHPAKTIILRDANRTEIEVPRTKIVARMHKKIVRINEAVIASDLRDQTGTSLTAPVVRIFNRDARLTRGGRLYARGLSWQNLPDAERRRLTIDGQAVVELDFAALHPTMLYAEAGLSPPADSYFIEGWDRKLVKTAILVLLNCRSAKQGLTWLAANADFMPEPSRMTERVKLAAELMQEIKRKHSPIAAAFHSDAGARLMRSDSDLAISVLDEIISQGEVAFPVHDSFIVRASLRDLAEEAMGCAAHRYGLRDISINKKL